MSKLRLIQKFYRDSNKVYNMLNNINLDDHESVKQFFKKTQKYLKFSKKDRKKDYGVIRKKLAMKKLKDIKYIIGKYKSIKNILDIGCEDCSHVHAIGRYLGAKQFHCVNVANMYELDRSQCGFQIYDGHNLPYNDNSMDAIILFQVLHHVRELNLLIKDIYRVLKKGGILIIKEHDCNTRALHKVIDIEHFIYELAINENYKYIKDYYGNYKSLAKWKKLFRGKKHVKKIDTPTNYFYMIVQK